ncbi:MAG TPA: (2Fe-2S)-binding protein, partial [Anaerolineales bacterium]
MNMVINGQRMTIEALPGEMLSDLLRERLGLIGTKIGCNEAECGACTVLVDDQPVLSCVFPAAKADGKNIFTIEGLASLYSIARSNRSGDGKEEDAQETLHPLQEAFIQHGAVQCGFCIPGQIMTAYALLRAVPEPSEADIRYALKDTLCRCAGYPTIIRAIQTAAYSVRTGEPLAPPPIPGLDEMRPHGV